jgi:WD40 repeat protein
MPLDEWLIDPAPEQLAGLMLKAMRAANARLRDRRLDKDLFFFHQFVRRAARKPEGQQQWTGGRGGVPAALLAVAWWTDRIGRRHWRVTGKRLDRSTRYARETAFTALPLWCLYPEGLAIRRTGKKDELLAVCRCGVCGTLESIGWVGDRCGPCHDRAQEGEEAPQAFARRLVGHTGFTRGLAFTADGRFVSGGYDGRLLLWDLESGEGKDLQNRSIGLVWPFVVSSAGVVAALTGRRRLLLRRLDGSDWQDVTLEGNPLSPRCFSPDGKWLAAVNESSIWLLDPQTGAWAPALAENRHYMGMLFSGDSNYLIACDSTGALQRLDLQTRESRPLPGLDLPVVNPAPEGEWDEDYYDPPLSLLAASPDGRSLVASSRYVAQPAGLHVLDLATERWSPLGLPQDAPVPWQVVYLPDGRLGFIGHDRVLYLWDPGRKRLLGPLLLDWTFHSYVHAFSRDGELFALGDHDGAIRLWPWRRLLEGH